MPWATGKAFASKHNHHLKGATATEAAKIATAMVNRGVPEGEAIATANARAEGKPRKKKRAKSSGEEKNLAGELTRRVAARNDPGDHEFR